MPYLDYDGDTRELKTGDLVVGSGNQAGWRLQNVDLAARHLVFSVGPDGATVVRPFNTAAMVTVNGRRVEIPTPLADGDAIAAGSTEFLYVADAKMPRAKTPVRPTTAYLVVDADEVAYLLHRKALHLGRDAGSTVQVKDPEVSRYHADVRTEAGLHVLYSMGEIGTTVNGVPVTGPRVLDEGDRIRIGEMELRYTRSKPPAPVHITAGGEDYDLEISQLPTGKVGRYQPPIERLKKPRSLRIVAVIVAIMAVGMIWLVVSI